MRLQGRGGGTVQLPAPVSMTGSSSLVAGTTAQRNFKPGHVFVCVCLLIIIVFILRQHLTKLLG